MYRKLSNGICTWTDVNAGEGCSRMHSKIFDCCTFSWILFHPSFFISTAAVRSYFLRVSLRMTFKGVTAYPTYSFVQFLGRYPYPHKVRVWISAFQYEKKFQLQSESMVFAGKSNFIPHMHLDYVFLTSPAVLWTHESRLIQMNLQISVPWEMNSMKWFRAAHSKYSVFSLQQFIRYSLLLGLHCDFMLFSLPLLCKFLLTWECCTSYVGVVVIHLEHEVPFIILAALKLQ